MPDITVASAGSTPPALPLVSVLIATRDRPELLSRCLESVLAQQYPHIDVVVLDDASRQNIAGGLAGRFGRAPVRWDRSEQRLGVAGARNRLVQEAAGEILVFLDDDAALESRKALHTVAGYFAKIANLGTLAFKIIVSVNGQAGLQVPFSRRWCRKNPKLAEGSRPVSYYVGAGHAIRKEAFRRCGLYQEDMVYGDEELDHAYRQIEAGFSLVYAPDVLVYHFPAVSLVQSDRDGRSKLYYLVRNRIWNGYKHIPLPYLVSYLGVWTLYFLTVGLREGSLGEFLRGAYTGFAAFRSLPRKCLGAVAVAYLKANYGRLWY
jgi:GT2 family glycosyltransferase